MPLQERVPDDIKKALVNNDNINIRPIRKPTGKVVRTKAESSLCTSDEHNILFNYLQRVRNVGSEFRQSIWLVTKGIRVAGENVIPQHFVDWTV